MISEIFIKKFMISEGYDLSRGLDNKKLPTGFIRHQIWFQRGGRKALHPVRLNNGLV